MMRTLLVALLTLFFLTPTSLSVAQDDGEEEDDALPTIEEKTEDFEKTDGFVPFYWDAKGGKLWLEISRFNEEFLYVSSLPAGLGSNDVGLDRGQLGTTRVVRFERVGPKVLLVEPNLEYRATSDNADERRAVRDAFASGVVHGFEVEAESDDGTVLVDATGFVVRDAHGVVRRLKNTDQGSFKLEDSRSAPYLRNTRGFPQNTELEARLTFVTDEEPGEYVRSVAADPFAVTLRVRHSLIQLPDEETFEQRRFDPRSSFYPLTYRDYAVPIGEDIPQRWIRRHRLTCAGERDADGLCTPDEPIVYYLDPGTPEPVRSALIEGGQWWNEAFEAAGFRDGFRVEVLPDTADAMDVRYNTIQWVHRSTRGWSYGMSVVDPRTGEIMKGHVTLGSLRVRQDYLLAEGLLAPYSGSNRDGMPDGDDPMLEMALARLRQLSAHEIGHTIGLMHNFAASADDRASVMDYPAPLATVSGDSISLADAYDTGIGEWDVFAVRYGYTPAEDQSEAELLEGIIQEYQDAGYRFLTDRDARPGGASEPSASLWDNGSDVVSALEREMDVRRVAMERFGETVIRDGEPMATLEDALVPLYLRHRYQVEATVKALGGVRYDYWLRGDDDALRPTMVEPNRQRAALDALLSTVTLDALRIPASVREQMAPRPPGHPDTRELFDGRTGLTFDPTAPAEVAASMVFTSILHPHRAMRLVQQHDANTSLPSLRSVLERTTGQVWESRVPDDAHDAELQRTVQQVWTDALLDHADHADVAPAVQARLTQHLQELDEWLEDNRGRDEETQAHRRQVRATLDRFLDRTMETDAMVEALETPPGSPIGSGAPWSVRQDARQKALLHWVPALDAACGEGHLGF